MRGFRLQIANIKAKKVWAKYHPDHPPVKHKTDCLKVCLGSYRKTKVFCSDPMCCGNPRKLGGKGGLTRQEKIAFLPDFDGW